MISWPTIRALLQCFLSFTVLAGAMEVVEAQQLALGSGSFVFLDPQGNSERPIKVLYYHPESFQKDGSILFAMHGGNRKATKLRNTWKKYADRDGHLLLCPEFSKEHYPDFRHYQMGYLKSRDGEFRDQQLWAITAIERIFDQVVEANHLQAKEYSIYGHSGGGQFVHRLVMFLPDARYNLAIAANPGWYTMFNSEVDYPFGISDAPINELQIRKSLDRKFVLLLGTADTNFLGTDNTNPKTDNPRQSAEAMKQGPNRLARGKEFFKSSQLAAKKLNVKSNWRMQFVEGVGHNNSQMSEFAAELLR